MLEEEHKSSLMSHGLQCRLNTTCAEKRGSVIVFFPIKFLSHIEKNETSYLSLRHMYKKITSTAGSKSNIVLSVCACFPDAHLHTDSCCGFTIRPQCSIWARSLSRFMCVECYRTTMIYGSVNLDLRFLSVSAERPISKSEGQLTRSLWSSYGKQH